jgi:AhpD family alkylhydroperoxidase
MNNLDFVQRELVALGAAMGSNCVPCVEHHISEARKAGLADSKISEAIQFADKIRKVPAAKVLNAALQLLGTQDVSDADTATVCGEGGPVATPQGPCCT